MQSTFSSAEAVTGKAMKATSAAAYGRIRTPKLKTVYWMSEVSNHPSFFLPRARLALARLQINRPQSGLRGLPRVA
jgi:hypothetical protein